MKNVNKVKHKVSPRVTSYTSRVAPTRWMMIKLVLQASPISKHIAQHVLNEDE
jgi:hypothetical protein